RTPEGLKKSTPVPETLANVVKISSSLPRTVDREIVDPTHWTITASVPIGIFEHFLGPLGKLNHQKWSGNFYKCADHSSHPHWASWNPIGEELNFHRPEFFAPILFQ